MFMYKVWYVYKRHSCVVNVMAVVIVDNVTVANVTVANVIADVALSECY